MAPVALNVAPGLRPWRQAGITHLLMDAALAGSLRAAAKAGASPRPRSSGTSPRLEESGKPAPISPSPKSGPIPSGSRSARPASPAWSAAWQSLWEQMAVAGMRRPAAVWTYAELGTDLRGQADDARRKILGALLAELRLPKGSHAFWPYCLPPDNAPDEAMFLAGLTRFRPGLVLLAGDRAVADLAGFGSLPSVCFQLASCRGFRFLLLPGLAEMANMAGPHREQLVTFIREAVRC